MLGAVLGRKNCLFVFVCKIEGCRTLGGNVQFERLPKLNGLDPEAYHDNDGKICIVGCDELASCKQINNLVVLFANGLNQTRQADVPNVAKILHRLTIQVEANGAGSQTPVSRDAIVRYAGVFRNAVPGYCSAPGIVQEFSFR